MFRASKIAKANENAAVVSLRMSCHLRVQNNRLLRFLHKRKCLSSTANTRKIVKKYVKMMSESFKNHHWEIMVMKFQQNRYKKFF